LYFPSQTSSPDVAQRLRQEVEELLEESPPPDNAFTRGGSSFSKVKRHRRDLEPVDDEQNGDSGDSGPPLVVSVPNDGTGQGVRITRMAEQRAG
jgi:hypothetical protein